MTYELSGVDVFFLSKELGELENSKIDKIVQIDRKLFSFRLFFEKKKKTIRLLVPELMNITEQNYVSPLTPLGFCSFLRKYLQNTKIRKIYQYEFERTIIIEFETLKHGELNLILEFFKPGNMILCKKQEENLIILNALEKQAFKSRKVESREEYIFPSIQNNPSKLSIEKLKELFTASDKIIGKTLAMDLSLGGIYAEEIAVRAGIDKNKLAAEISSTELKKLKEELDSFFNQKISCGKFKGRIYPVQMRSFEFEETFESFNKGLDSIIIENISEDKKAKGKKVQKNKTEKLLGIQLKRIKELEKEIDENQKAGEFVYEHYQEFSKLLEAVKNMREKGKTYDEIEEELKKNKHFKGLDKSKKIVSMDF
jgi:predicted ribosome quality control (RQC) complex YloA/Tae2 family protein